MITVDFSQRGENGLCEHLYLTIKKQILDSTLKANSKLPSKRTLSSHLGVSIITVQNAYSQLISEGYIYSIEKKGFYVTDISSFHSELLPLQQKVILTSKENKDPQIPHYFVDFTSNTANPDKFPFALWSHTMRQVLNDPDEKLLQRSSIKGVFELRKAIADYLMEFRNMQVSPEQIVIGAGTEALYSMIVQFFGRDKTFAVENPGYKKSKHIFELNGATCIPILTDSHGITPEELDSSHAQIVHLSPNHHFPTGIVMPVRRRLELLSWTKQSQSRFIIEDDYDSEFRFNGKPLPTMQSMDHEGKVIYINTFTKTLSPSFRISYMVLPEKLIHDFENKLSPYSCQVSSFEQYTLARFMREGFYEKHINRMRNHYRTLRNNLISELQNSPLMPISRITEEEAGLHFLLTIDSEKTPEQLQKSLAENGIKLSLLSDYFYQNNADSECTFVINYSALKKESIAETVSRMCRSL